MKIDYLSALILSCVSLCAGQTTAPPDPTLDATGLPAYLKLLNKPAAEPWSKITEKERFDLYASYTFSPFAGLTSLAAGAITQAANKPEEWGQGWGAFGIRSASSYGTNFVAQTITYGTSALFKDNNRYFRSPKGGAGARLGHVIISPFVARNDSGQTRFSTSSFLGGVGGAGIPLLWSPPSWQDGESAAVNAAVWYAGLAGVNLIREFYPSLVRHYKRGNKAPAGNTSVVK